MKYLRITLFTLIVSFISISNIQGQDCDELSDNLYWDFQVVSSQGNINQGDIIFVECFVENFTEIISFQYTLQFDPTVLEFNSFDNLGSPLIGSIDGNFTPQFTDIGKVPILWTNAIGEGQTILSNSGIYKIFFNVIGDPNDCIALNINSSVVDLEIAFELDNGNSCIELDDFNFGLSGAFQCIACDQNIFIDAELCNGELNFSACGGTGSYSYTIGGSNLSDQGMFNLGDSINYSDLENEGTIIISVADETGNNTALSLTNIEYDPLSIEGETFCSNATTILSTADNFSTYEWISPTGVILTTDSTEPWSIQVSQGGQYTLNTTREGCSESAQFLLEEQLPPNLTTQFITLCNSSADGNTIIQLSSIFENTTGTFLDADGMITEINVENFDVGTYTFSIEAEAIQPCDNEWFEIEVEVVNCNCPELILNPIGNFCNSTAYNINLLNLLSPGTEANGTFTIASINGEVIQTQEVVDGNLIIEENSTVGEFILQYTLEDVPVGCPNIIEQLYRINLEPIVEFLTPEAVCNSDTLGNNTIVELNNYVIGSAGIWQDNNGNTILNSVVDFNGAVPGIYSFEFTTNEAQEPCEDVSVDFEIEVIDCITSITDILSDPVINLFPNPSHGELNLELDGKSEIIIYDVTGRIRIQASLNEGMNSILLEGLNGGLYLLEFYQAGRLVGIEKLFKQ